MTDFYPQDDVQQILQIAIARQAESEELTREQLLEIAAELGISSENLQAAEQEWQSRRKELLERQSFNEYRRGKWRQHLIQYLLVNSFLVLLNVLLAANHLPSWSLYVVLCWGLGLAWDAWKRYQIEGEQYEQAFQWWRRKRQIGRSVNSVLDKVLKA